MIFNIFNLSNWSTQSENEEIQRETSFRKYLQILENRTTNSGHWNWLVRNFWLRRELHSTFPQITNNTILTPASEGWWKAVFSVCPPLAWGCTHFPPEILPTLCPCPFQGIPKSLVPCPFPGVPQSMVYVPSKGIPQSMVPCPFRGGYPKTGIPLSEDWDTPFGQH